MQVLIRQARVLDKNSDFHNKIVDILVADGIIKDIAEAIDAKADKVIEGKGLCVSAGWVDILADYAEPGYEHRETIDSGLKAAAAGGFTDVLLAPNTQPTVSSKSIIEYVQNRAAGHATKLRPLGSISHNIEGNVLAEMMDMRSQGAVAFTDGWKPVQNPNLMLKALEYVKAFNGLLMQIPVDASLSSNGLMHEGPVSTNLGMPGIPSLAETLVIHRDIELLRYTNSRLHLTGISSAEGVDMIRRAKADGLSITCSVTPYHLVLTDEALKTYNSAYKVSPPLRSEADRQALIAGLKDGTIDCIASHHRPQDWDAKEKEFDYAAYGMNIQQVAFNIALQALDAETLVNALSANPRKIFGLPDTSVRKDAVAELTIFTTEGSHQLKKEELQSIGYNNPFVGQELPGSVLAIINKKNTHINEI